MTEHIIACSTCRFKYQPETGDRKKCFKDPRVCLSEGKCKYVGEKKYTDMHYSQYMPRKGLPIERKRDKIDCSTCAYLEDDHCGVSECYTKGECAWSGTRAHHKIRYSLYTPAKGVWVGPRKAPNVVSGEEDLPSESEDSINHPSHYTSHPSGVECIEIVQHFPFNIGAAVKYLWRCGLKGNKDKAFEDLEKAKVFIDFEIKRLKDREVDYGGTD